MKYILRFSVVLLIGLLLSCGSSQNNSKEINELLKSDFSIELNKTDVIVTDSIELAIKPDSEQSYAAQIEFFNTNLEFINLDEMSSDVIKKDNNKLIVDNQSGNVNLSFKSNIMSRFFVVVTIIRGDHSFSKEFKVEVNNQEGDNSFDEVVQNLGDLYASVYNETDLPIKYSDDGLAIFIGKENLYYTIKDLSPKSSSIVKTDVSYSKDMLSLNIMLKNDDKLVFDSEETHYVKTFGNQQPIVRLRVKSSLIRVVNNGDQKILSLRMATSKEAVMKSKNLISSLNKGEVFKNNVYYINNNCGSIFYHIEREGVLLEDIKMVDIECDQTDNEVNISTADDLFPAKNTLKIVNAAPFPLKSVMLDGKKYIFDEPLSINQFRFVALPSTCSGNIVEFNYELGVDNFVSKSRYVPCDETLIIQNPAVITFKNKQSNYIKTIDMLDLPLEKINSDFKVEQLETLKSFMMSNAEPFLKAGEEKQVIADCSIDHIVFDYLLEGKKSKDRSGRYFLFCGDKVLVEL